MIFEFTFIIVNNPDTVSVTFSKKDVPEGMHDLVCDVAHTVGHTINMRFPDGLSSDMLMCGTIDSKTKRFSETSFERMPSKDTPIH